MKRFGEVAESTPCQRGRKVHSVGSLGTAVDTDELLRAIVEFLRIWREQAPENVRTSWGMIYRDDRFPLIHQANLGWVATLTEGGPQEIIDDLANSFRGTAVTHHDLPFENAETAFAAQVEFV